MGKSIEVLKIGELANGQMKAVKVDESEILVARDSDDYYAVSNVCPHRGGKLSQGRLEGTIVECPIHGSRFDITNGRVLRRLNGGFTGKLLGLLKIISSIKTYKVKVEGDNIMVEV